RHTHTLGLSIRRVPALLATALNVKPPNNTARRPQCLHAYGLRRVGTTHRGEMPVSRDTLPLPRACGRSAAPPRIAWPIRARSFRPFEVHDLGHPAMLSYPAAGRRGREPWMSASWAQVPQG